MFLLPTIRIRFFASRGVREDNSRDGKTFRLKKEAQRVIKSRKNEQTTSIEHNVYMTFIAFYDILKTIFLSLDLKSVKCFLMSIGQHIYCDRSKNYEKCISN